MLNPGNTPKAPPALVLSPLLETPLPVSFGNCTLSREQTSALEDLGTLWGKVVAQLTPLLDRNRPALGSLAESHPLSDLFPASPFLTSWPTLAQISKLLVEQKAPDAQEAKDLLNAMHETALLATLLGSFGVGPFVARCVEKLSALHSSPSSLPRFARRLYSHALTLKALNSQLTGLDFPALSPASFSPSLPASLKQSLESFVTSGAPLHSKEQLIINEALRLLSPGNDPGTKLVVATSDIFTSQLTARLKRALASAPAGFVQERGRGLADTALTSDSSDARVLVAPVSELLSIQPNGAAGVLLYSPLVLHSQQMLRVTSNSLAQLREHFSAASVEILRAESLAFPVDRALYEQAMKPDASSTSSIAAPGSSPVPTRAAVPPSTAGAEPAAARHRKSITVTRPKTAEQMLFSQEELAATAPVPHEAARPELPKVDPATLPATIEELNTRLGISMLKPALTVRPDQLQPLFEMLVSGSMRWLVKAPTGFGKTPFACMVTAVILGDSPMRPAETRRGRRVAYVTPNVDLCEQVKREFLKFLDLKDSDIAILNGQTPARRRGAILANPDTKLIVCTPETLRKAFAKAPAEHALASVSMMIVDEFQSAEGDHPMACLVRDAQAADVPVLVQSGTPARDEDDLGEKQQLVSLRGALVPKTPQPLKNHELLSSYISPERATLVNELNTFSFVPYIACREQLANAESLVKQALGQETPTLFDSRIKLQRKPHIQSFGQPSSGTFEKLKVKAKGLRVAMREHQLALRENGQSLDSKGLQALTEINLASLNIARMSSLVSRTNLLANAGTFSFLHDFASTWIARYLEAPRRHGAFPAFQDFFRDPHLRSVVRAVAEGTPYIHLLQSPTCAEALQRAFGLAPENIPGSPQQRRTLFLQLAMLEMSKRQELDHPKEAKIFARIEELQRLDQARGIIVFAEPRYLTKHLALRLHHRFHQKGIQVAFATGEGDGFAGRLLASLEAQRSGDTHTPRSALGSWEEVRAAFQRKPGEPGERADIIVATSRLAVGHNLSAAAEAHIFSMHADAQKLIQQIGRVGRPDGDNFFGRVGQCFYHVTRNTPEWYLFLSAIKKYRWMRSALAESEAFPPESDDK